MKATQKQIELNLFRLSKIKNEITTNKHKGILTIRSVVRGSTHLYTILKKNGIIKRDNNGYFYWNISIPVTYTLAKTTSDQCYDLAKSYLQKNAKKQVKKKTVFSLFWGLIKFSK